jgi:Leucine-rich repeat (LRR) protein
LQHNKLKALPDAISKLISLRDLNLFGNKLEDAGFPHSLFQIKTLTKLDLECNFITSIPAIATQKKNLTLLLDPTVNISEETKRGNKKQKREREKIGTISDHINC